VSEVPLSSPVVKLEAIAEACRPMAALLRASAAGRDPSVSDLAVATARLAGARRAPGRIGWAVGIILDGGTVGSRMEQAVDIVVRVAGYHPPAGPRPDVDDVTAYRKVAQQLRRPRRPRAVGSSLNQPAFPGFD
jgi:hypothetical protein